ncbi:MAG: creatininase family protein, partial [Prochlorococcus sp.]
AWLTDDLSVSGVIGDSRGANATLGKALQQALVAHWLNLLTSLMASSWPPVRDNKGL